jgi:hypothetical protein
MDRRSLVPRGANGALKLERIPRSGVVLTRSRGHVRSKQRGSVRLLCAPPPFELCWRQHPDRAVQPPAVVEGLDELEDRRASDSSRRERVTVRELAFDRCEQALGRGVLKRRPDDTHRRGDPRLSEPPGERQRDVLRSLIRVMYESRRRSSARGRHLERVHDEPGSRARRTASTLDSGGSGPPSRRGLLPGAERPQLPGVHPNRVKTTHSTGLHARLRPRGSSRGQRLRARAEVIPASLGVIRVRTPPAAIGQRKPTASDPSAARPETRPTASEPHQTHRVNFRQPFGSEPSIQPAAPQRKAPCDQGL